MRISQKAKHAIEAILDLALHGPAEGDVRSSEIAGRTGVPDRFIETILLDLRRSGFINSRRGPTGGHRLARDPARLTVAEILAAIDGPLAVPVRPTRRHPTPADACLQALWASAAAAVQEVIGGVTIEDLRRRASPPAGADFTI